MRSRLGSGVTRNGIGQEATMGRAATQEYDVTRNHPGPLGADWPEQTPAIHAWVSGSGAS
jgi:hypothetical protein